MAIVLVILIYIAFQGSYIPHFCLLEEILHLKCSFCGLTHSFEELFQGNIVNAIKINYMSVGILLFFVLKETLNQFGKTKNIPMLENTFILFCLIQFIDSNIFS